ncbi:MAG: flavin reductase [Anaerolineae bacterium]|nr:flavin reductase [Anaerolineae bacterium]
MIDLREMMRHWVTGVSIVTAELDGKIHGMTVGSLVSISIDPPRICITLANQTRTHKMVTQTGLFGVTLLAYDQQSIADRFAGVIPDDGDRMAGLTILRLSQNIPVIAEGLGEMACRVIHQYEMPTSTLFIGEVLEARKEDKSTALVYGNRNYHPLEL